jgi:hypothetical protein
MAGRAAHEDTKRSRRGSHDFAAMEETGHAHLAQASEDGTRVVGLSSVVAAVGILGLGEP